MSAITVDMLEVQCGLQMRDILGFRIEQCKNNHTLVRITGIISEDEGVSSSLLKQEGSPLTVLAVGEDEPLLLFGGFINALQITHEGGGYIAVLEGISSTDLLDREEKCRSFQDVDMTYKELVRKVLADTPDTEVIFHITDQKIGFPIYQYQETDWDFLKRVASQLGTSLLPAGISLKPELYFGLPRGVYHESDGIRIERIWFDQSYYQFFKKSAQIKKDCFVCRDIISYEKWKCGDRLLTEDGMEAVVTAVQAELEHGLLTWHYTTAQPEAFGTPRYENPRLAGLSLAGTVLETREESFRIWLNIDQEQPGSKTFWYPWMPETGNMMYCMPEAGEMVEITLDDDRGNARGSRCIHRNVERHAELHEPSKRYFTTAQDKRMYLLPESVGFVDLKQKVPLKIDLDDSSGITIESSRGIDLLARSGVWLKAGVVSFIAPQEISILRRDLSDPVVINMCNGFDSIGKFGEVRMKGDGVTDFPILDNHAKEYEMSEDLKEAVIASTPRIAGSTETERKIIGTKVDSITMG